MSTRGNIVIKKGNKSITLYHHHDCYPTGVGYSLCYLFQEFKTLPNYEELMSSPELFGKWLSDDERDDEFEYEGETKYLHGDIEYLYVIDLDEKTVTCYKLNDWNCSYNDIVS